MKDENKEAMISHFFKLKPLTFLKLYGMSRGMNRAFIKYYYNYTSLNFAFARNLSSLNFKFSINIWQGSFNFVVSPYTRVYFDLKT